MESCKCCVHCRGDSLARGCDELHEDRSDRPSSSGKHAPGCPKSRRTFEEKQNGVASCYDKFALAKRLHAENLQHQPLPDRVDDSVFKRGCRCCSAKDWDARYRERAIVPAREEDCPPFAPALGCKKPKTRMDLAICWETPIDPVYEPRRSTHIDGSEGGSAPAIFALIQHTPAPRNRELLARDDAKRAEAEGRVSRCCCDRSCDELHERPERGPSRGAKSSKSAHRVTEQKCVACRQRQELERREKDPRLIRSAVGIALGLEKDRGAVRDADGARSSPTRTTVPRPRTPFARRAFCIDTLSPPFSVMKGRRDADYPEHWRLVTMYQQSYRNPHKRKSRHF